MLREPLRYDRATMVVNQQRSPRTRCVAFSIARRSASERCEAFRSELATEPPLGSRRDDDGAAWCAHPVSIPACTTHAPCATAATTRPSAAGADPRMSRVLAILSQRRRRRAREHAEALREEILREGLDADRALALGNALEAAGQLLEAIEVLSDANRLRQDAGVEHRLVRLRRRAFTELDRSLAPPWAPSRAAPGAPLSEGPATLAPSRRRAGRL